MSKISLGSRVSRWRPFGRRGEGPLKAVAQTFGQAAWVQRCQVHKTRNILEYLSDRQRPWVHAILRRAYGGGDAAKGRRLLEDLAANSNSERGNPWHVGTKSAGRCGRADHGARFVG
jgi:hypothetical protein